jgi:hypothetical protein
MKNAIWMAIALSSAAIGGCKEVSPPAAEAQEATTTGGTRTGTAPDGVVPTFGPPGAGAIPMFGPAGGGPTGATPPAASAPGTSTAATPQAPAVVPTDPLFGPNRGARERELFAPKPGS